MNCHEDRGPSHSIRFPRESRRKATWPLHRRAQMSDPSPPIGPTWIERSRCVCAGESERGDAALVRALGQRVDNRRALVMRRPARLADTDTRDRDSLWRLRARRCAQRETRRCDCPPAHDQAALLARSSPVVSQRSVTPSTSARAERVAAPGSCTPHSHREMVSARLSSLSASSCCVRRAAMRACFTRFPKPARPVPSPMRVRIVECD